MNQQNDGAATILLTEDETLIRLVLVDALEDAGFTVVEAQHAQEAMEIIAQRGCVDLLVTDVRMPGSFDGLDLARWVRTRCAATKVVVMSGFVLGGQESAARAFDDFMDKPLSALRLVERVRELLAH